MNLSTQDAELFFKLFFALLAYANRQHNIVPNATAPDDLRQIGFESVAKIRNDLYAHPKLLTGFVAENPNGLTPEELNLVASWKQRVSGEFYLMRYLKKYAVFMSTKGTAHLYGVLGLFDPIEVVVRGQPLPVYLKTTLLPFQGQIIWDGIIEPWSVFFGKGIRTDLDAQYNRLKQKEGIIEQLVNAEGAPELRTSLKARATKPAPDWKPRIDDIVAQADKMRRADTPEQSAALALLRAAAHLTQASFDESRAVDAELKQVRRALGRVENVFLEAEWE